MARSGSFIVASAMTTALLGYLTWVAAAAGFSKGAVGSATAAASAMVLGGLVGHLGLPLYLLRRLPEWSARDQPMLARRAIVAAVLGGGAVGSVAAILEVALQPVGSVGAAVSLGLAVALGAAAIAVGVVLDYLAIARGRPSMVLMRNGALSFTELVVVVAAVKIGLSSVQVLWWAWTGPSVLGALLPLRSVRRWWARRPAGATVPRLRLRELSGYQATLVGGQAAVLALPSLALARGGESASADFYIAWMMASATMMIGNSLCSSLVAEGARQPQRRAALMRRAVLLSIGAYVPAAVAVLALAPRLLSMFGHGYGSTARHTLLLLVAGSVPDAITSLWVAERRLRDRPWDGARLYAITSTVTVTLAFVLVPGHGAPGAALAWVCGQSTGVVCIVTMALARALRLQPWRARGRVVISLSDPA